MYINPRDRKSAKTKNGSYWPVSMQPEAKISLLGSTREQNEMQISSGLKRG